MNWEKKMSTTNNAAAAHAETPEIGPYTYIARNGQILQRLAANDFGDYDAVRCAPYYAEKKLADWERDGKIAFGEFVGHAKVDGDWEFNGSSSYEPDERQDSWVVAVYESPIADFAGDQLDALTEHPETVLHGYVEFVDQKARYQRFVDDLDDLARVTAYKEHLIEPVGDVLFESREHYDPLADIDEVLSSHGCYYDGVSVIHGCRPEAA